MKHGKTLDKKICSIRRYGLPLFGIALTSFIAVFQGAYGDDFSKKSAEATVVTITASSNLFPSEDSSSPKYLMEENKVIWHASKPSKYPEYVEIVYSKPTQVNKLGIRAQGDSPNGNEHTRAPKDFVFQGSNDKVKWIDLLKVKDNIYKQGGEWKEWNVKNKKEYVYYRIYITYSGNPDLLTIQQIRLVKE